MDLCYTEFLLQCPNHIEVFEGWTSQMTGYAKNVTSA